MTSDVVDPEARFLDWLQISALSLGQTDLEHVVLLLCASVSSSLKNRVLTVPTSWVWNEV